MTSYSPSASLRRLTFGKIRKWVLPGLRNLHLSRWRKCSCCGRSTLIVSLDPSGEVQRCVRCGANLRYELLAEVLRDRVTDLPELTVLELDPNSPLRSILSRAQVYHRSFFDPTLDRGLVRDDGARCEDITQLTFPAESLDLVVSSEVLEHVPDVRTAAAEIARVLKPGSRHIFTVPTSDTEPTRQRARISNGTVEHLLPPEYHGDPQGKGGILAYWSFGRDLPDYFEVNGTRTRIVREARNRKGDLLRVVWETVRVE